LPLLFSASKRYAPAYASASYSASYSTSASYPASANGSPFTIGSVSLEAAILISSCSVSGGTWPGK